METNTDRHGRVAHYEPLVPADIAGVITTLLCHDAGAQYYVMRLGVRTDDGQFKTVIAWSEDKPTLRKGQRVRVIGRVRHQRYLDSQGGEKTFEEILAKEIYTR